MIFKKYKLIIGYCGTLYCGWQRQDSDHSGPLKSIQGLIEIALQKATGETMAVVASGRTDAGVHALAQVAHIRLKNWDKECWKLKNAINYYLPTDIQIMSLEEVPLEFHAQRSAIKKQYSYWIQLGEAPHPLLVDRAWWLRFSIDPVRMQSAFKKIEGEFDFKVFQGKGATPGPTVRTIFDTEVSSLLYLDEVPMVRIRVVGSGFLKQMVRSIAGFLVDIGQNRREIDDLLKTVELKDRQLLCKTAPAHGLCLDRVWYC